MPDGMAGSARRIRLVGDGLPQRMPHQRAIDPGAPDFRVGLDAQNADDLPVLDRQPEAFLDRQRELAEETRDVGGGRVKEADVVFGVAVEAGNERDHGSQGCWLAAGDAGFARVHSTQFSLSGT